MATKRIPLTTTPKNMDAPAVAQPTRPSPPLLLSPSARYAAAADRLEEVGVMLHGLNRLHKNQHRVSTFWWPAFGQLRRHVRRLEEEVRPLKDLVKDGADEKEQREEEKRAIERARGIRENFIPEAYLAFSRLIADRRFAQLGLLMTGILAQVHTTLRWVIGDTATKKRHTDNGEDDGDDLDDDEEGVEAEVSDGPPEDLGDDLGEVIAREDDSDGEDTKTQPPPSSADGERKTTTASTQPTKKRARQDDDIGDNDSSNLKSLRSLEKPTSKNDKAEPAARSEKKRKVEEDTPIPRPREIKEAKDISEKRDKKDKKEKKDKEKDKAKKTKKRKKNGDEFDDLFSGLL